MGLLLAWPGLPAVADDADTYLRAIKPLLTRRCVSCHGALMQKSGLRVDTAAALRRGGDSGPAVEPGNPDESYLLEVLDGSAGLRMPPEGEPLSAGEVETIRSWIAAGAAAPRDEEPQRDPRGHWAFQPPRGVPAPSSTGAGWAQNPIDSWIAAGHDAHGLVRAPESDRATLLRRVSLDLTGLVPTSEELQAFLDDPSALAYERAVDRLLASPLYGERWGRHWLDIWRYSDWDGFGAEIRESQPHIWRWRDWVVESLNADKPYARMIAEMLAGDELEPENPDTVRATGYLARNWYKFNRNVWLDSIVEHTSKAFLGITINCARCHDHKYDPIAQADYYRFRAIFEPHDIRSDPVAGKADASETAIARVYDAKADTPTYLFHRGDEKAPDQEHPLEPGVPAVLGTLPRPEPRTLPVRAYVLSLRAEARNDALTRAERLVSEARAALDGVITRLLELAPDSAEAARVWHERDAAMQVLTAARAEQESVRARIEADDARYRLSAGGKHAEVEAYRAARMERTAKILRAQATLAQKKAELEQAQAGEAAKLDSLRAAVASAGEALKELESTPAVSRAYTPIAPLYPDTTTGRRTALAGWITGPENTLAARVAVNHVWLRHFGRPLVESVFDFGQNGAAPTHPELLDWLAVEFRESGWSLKHLHRLIVTSAAYRMDSGTSESVNRERDPANRYVWRMNPRRLEAELVRDNLLFVAGSLDLRQGGPDLDPAGGLSVPRRSLYFRHAKEKRVTFLKLFDSANATSCYRRDVSVVPQQALALINSALAIGQARRIAGSLAREQGGTSNDHERFVDAAFRRLLGRPPRDDELSACMDYLHRESSRLADPVQLVRFDAGPEPTVLPASDPTQRARENLVLVLFNHHEFVTIR